MYFLGVLLNLELYSKDFVNISASIQVNVFTLKYTTSFIANSFGIQVVSNPY